MDTIRYKPHVLEPVVAQIITADFAAQLIDRPTGRVVKIYFRDDTHPGSLQWRFDTQRYVDLTLSEAKARELSIGLAALFGSPKP